MAITLTKITDGLHQSAINWIMDAFPHQEVEASYLSAQQAHRVISRHYSGGWVQFVTDQA